MAVKKRGESFPSAIKALKSSVLCSIVPGVQGFMLAFLRLEIFSGRKKINTREECQRIKGVQEELEKKVTQWNITLEKDGAAIIKHIKNMKTHT